MLRIITAVLLLTALIALLFFAPPFIFTVALFIVGALASWEAWRMLQPGSTASLVGMLSLYAGFLVFFIQIQSANLYLIMGLIHVVLTTLCLRYKPKLQNMYVAVYTAVYLAIVVCAVIELQKAGVWILLTAFLMVWAVDVGGYFFGKGLGGKLIQSKLAPEISPKKSWEGAIGGALLAAVLAVCMMKYSTEVTFYHISNPMFNPAGMVFLMTFILAAYSITGDLVESLMKRQAGVKDSSQLLPGHGGVLDRIDALIPVLPLCAAWVLYK